MQYIQCSIAVYTVLQYIKYSNAVYTVHYCSIYSTVLQYPGDTLPLLGPIVHWPLPSAPQSLAGTRALQLKAEVVKISPVSPEAEEYFRSQNMNV